MRLAAIGLFALASASCDDHVIGRGVPIQSTCLRQPPLDYENTGKGLIGQHCRSCHGVFQVGPDRAGAPAGMDFDDEQDILDRADQIYDAAVIRQTMPPAAGMTEEERERLEEWIRCDVFPKLGQVDLEGVDAEVQ